MISQIESDLALLRGLVVRELDTINSYRRLAAECDDQATVEFFMHVVAEEKFHIADALHAIALLDPDQAGLLQSGFASGHGPGDVPSHGAGRASNAGDSSIRLADGGDPVFPAELDAEPLRQVPNSRGIKIISVSSDSAGRDVADSATVTSGTDDREGLTSDRAPGSDTTRVPNTWTVGSLRRVPQNE